MTVNIYDDANQMATHLQELPQFLGLQNAFAALKKTILPSQCLRNSKRNK